MGLQARYDPKQDRMLLVMNFGEGEQRVFWFTRRLWHALLHEIAELKLAGVEDAALPPPTSKHRPALPRQPEAVEVESVRLRKLANGGIRLFFAAVGQEDVTLTLQVSGVMKFQRMLEQQAERAGWDPRAAMERLNAGMLARRVVHKARGQS